MVDMQQLMQMAGDMRGKMMEAQKKAAASKFEGEAGGGLVKVVVNGRNELLELNIDPTATEDIGLLEDLVRAAVNQANAKATEAVQGDFGSMAQGFGFDPSVLSGLFGG